MMQRPDICLPWYILQNFDIPKITTLHIGLITNLLRSKREYNPSLLNIIDYERSLLSINFNKV